MPSARNASLEARAFGVLDFAERIARNQTESLSRCDYDFASECVQLLNGDLAYLTKQASALWTPAFERALNSSHSMRCTVIELSEKERRRCTRRRCDACGRTEYCNGWKIDLAGGSVDPAAWSTAASNASWHTSWTNFITRYEHDINEEPRVGELKGCDLGCFFVGETCMKKAKLHFMAATLFTETIYSANLEIRSLMRYGNELQETELYTVSDNKVEELIERKKHLELCVADERRHDEPELLLDTVFWDALDEARLEVGTKAELEHALRVRTTETIGGTGGTGVDESEQEEEEDEEVSASRSARITTRVVVSSDEEEDEEEEEEVRVEKTVRASKRLRGVDVDADSPPPAVSPAPAPAPPPPAAASTAAQVARQMRIPHADGTPSALGSRRSVLLGLINVQRDLILKREDGLAAQVGSAIVTFQELLEIADKQRGVAGSR